MVGIEAALQIIELRGSERAQLYPIGLAVTAQMRARASRVGRRLRARFGRDAMLLVATTGFGRDEDRRRTGEAGFDGHLVKPIDPTAVQALLSGIGGVSYPNRNARSARHGP
jgi:CheY-like chemotaxis protein